jgi:hypothetical protein
VTSPIAPRWLLDMQDPRVLGESLLRQLDDPPRHALVQPELPLFRLDVQESAPAPVVPPEPDVKPKIREGVKIKVRKPPET